VKSPHRVYLPNVRAEREALRPNGDREAGRLLAVRA
jgi:hypothetical protein